MKKIIHLRKNRRGYALLEFLLNLLIYFPVFLLLFQISLVPLQQFYLTQAARSGALVYIQIKHYDKNKNVEEILKDMLPGFRVNNSYDAKKITEDFVKWQFENSLKDNALPGRIFDTSKIEVEVEDTGIGGSSLDNALKAFADLFSTEEVKVTITYPFTVLKVFNLSFGVFNLEGKYSVQYNP
jgi:competence protein ComGC